MPIDTPAPTDRHQAILDAAVGVFLRYGYRKTSMDDLARAAELSRQGLYLHFPSKEALFTQAVTRLTGQALAAMRASLAREGVALEERLVGAFTALHAAQGQSGGPMPLEHMAEIVATARQLVGPVLAAFEQALVEALEQAIAAAGATAPGLTARALALHLQAASHGLKHHAATAADYEAGMRVAARLVCGAGQS